VNAVRPTLPGRDYWSEEVYDLDRERVFFREWCCVARADEAREPGDFVTVDLAGESLIVIRGADGELRCFYNVCRHRGARLCDAETRGRAKRALKCPYHAWSYAHDGRLIGTPLVGKTELDRSQLGLWPVALETWQGFVFVNLGEPRETLLESLERQTDRPRQYERWHMDELRSAHRTVADVEANWKILVENYNECLHCPTVHPELVAVVPTFGKGLVIEEGRDEGDWGVSIVEGGVGLTRTGTTELPRLPGLDEHDAHSVYGACLFPNMFVDLTGTAVVATRLHPRSASHTTVVTDYLFRPEAIEEDGFDPSEVIDFNELVLAQDNAVCERVQQGVRSRAFTHGVYAEKDDLPYRFNRTYLAARERE
jgi:phenylpropionate dioxygenase-like ring-hydroxylating dioxygenase large terminal subunit